jgi:hypothetical protein
VSEVTTPALRTCSIIEGRAYLQAYADLLMRLNKTDGAMSVYDCLVHYPRPKDMLDVSKSLSCFSVPE